MRVCYTPDALHPEYKTVRIEDNCGEDMTNQKRRIDDQKPTAKIDWSKPESLSMELSSTAGAARQGGITSLEGLTRYDHQGCCMSPDATGDYLLISDVRNLLATQAQAAAPATDYTDCCDTPYLCSAVRRCTAKDSAHPAAAVQPTTDENEILSVLQEIVSVANAEPECITEAMWKPMTDARVLVKGFKVVSKVAPPKVDRRHTDELLKRLQWAVRFIETYASNAAGPATPELNKCRAAIEAAETAKGQE